MPTFIYFRGCRNRLKIYNVDRYKKCNKKQVKLLLQLVVYVSMTQNLIKEICFMLKWYQHRHVNGETSNLVFVSTFKNSTVRNNVGHMLHSLKRVLSRFESSNISVKTSFSKIIRDTKVK